jgi:hypothetical protein
MARVERLRAMHPAEPWRWDYAWDERGAVDNTAAQGWNFLLIGVMLLAFLTPFHWLGFSDWRGIPFALAALLFDAVAVGLLAAAGYFFARRLKYGKGVALFARFPFRRGSTLELHVQAPRTLPQHAVATATLRCIQERYVTTRRNGETDATVQCFELYRDKAPTESVNAGFGRALRVRFEIPAGAPTTDLASRPCRYWEVDVEASTDGVDYGARFLVPVY